MRSLLFILFLTCAAPAQDSIRNRITFSGGWSRQLQTSSFDAETATGLGLSYGFRPLRFLELEGGVFTELQPGPEMCTRNFCLNPNDRYIRIPFGFRLVAPLGRWEVSAGGGGLRTKYWVSNPYNPFSLHSHDGWGEYAAGGVAVALDRNRHGWLGFAPRFFLSNPPDVHDRWNAARRRSDLALLI